MQVRLVCLLPAASLLSGCGGGGSVNQPPPASYTISGFVNNLRNSPMKLQDNGGDTITVQNYGAFTFPTALKNGSTYNVTILTQPTNGQTCAMQNGSGTVTGNINSVLVNCYEPLKIGGLVFGLLGSGLTLDNNGGDTLAISGDGAFQFSATINYGQNYDVTVLTQPANPAQICRVSNATSANLPQSDVANVLVSCGTATAHWTWMGGSQSTSIMGIYGQQGVPAPGNNPGARGLASTWTDLAGNFWLFGGSVEVPVDQNDLWRYSNGEWAWISGSQGNNNPPGVYGTLGVPNALNTPGARVQASSWTDRAGNLWLFGGYGATASGYAWFNDLWEFSNNQWTWVAGSNQPNQPPVYGTQGVADAANTPGARFGAVTWVDAKGDLWLFGGNDVNIYTSGGSSREQNDLWKFSGGKWTWVGGSNDPTTAQSGVYGKPGVASASNTPGARDSAATWVDGSGAFWLFGGEGIDSAGTLGTLNDLWRYANGEWTWMSGSNLVGSLGSFGTMGVPAAGNVPSARGGPLAWVDKAGNLWLFGGGGYDSTGNDGALNDLWRYSAGEWTYVSGSPLARQPSYYGPLGVQSANSLPGGCSGNMSWTDKSGNLWAYCFNDNNQAGTVTSANDLWMYQP